MKKRFLCLALAGLMLLSLGGCGKESESAAAAESAAASSAQPVLEPEPIPEPEPEPEPVPEVPSGVNPLTGMPMEEEYEEYEDSRDSVAEALIRWVPPITAILCAAIALCGFVYYQFVL